MTERTGIARQGSTAVASPRFKRPALGGRSNSDRRHSWQPHRVPRPRTLGGSHRNLQGPLYSVRTAYGLLTCAVRKTRLLGIHHSLPIVIRSPPFRPSRGCLQNHTMDPSDESQCESSHGEKGDEFPHAVSGFYYMASTRHFLAHLLGCWLMNRGSHEGPKVSWDSHQTW